MNLESCPIAEAKGFLRDAIYEELNMQWAQYDGAHTCHAVQNYQKPKENCRKHVRPKK